MEREGKLQCVCMHDSDTGPYFEPAESIPYPHINFFKIPCVNIISYAPHFLISAFITSLSLRSELLLLGLCPLGCLQCKEVMLLTQHEKRVSVQKIVSDL